MEFLRWAASLPRLYPTCQTALYDLDTVKAAIRGTDYHQPITRLLILENTQNRCGGAVLTPEYTAKAGELVRSKGVKLHLDGARVFNAAAALGVKASALTNAVDSVTFCLSKGLCAPVGSVLCGTTDFIEKARRIRKQLGGGMRQAGVLAAAGIIALEQMVDRLPEDHARARRLADGLSALPGLEFPMGMPQSNMVFVQLPDSLPTSAKQVAAQLREQGVKVGVVSDRMFRLVLHYWVDDSGIDQTLKAFRSVL